LDEGKFLVKLARQTIEGYLRTWKKPHAPKVGAKLKGRRGVFVTLTKDGELRGCIGHPLPTMLLVEAVIDAAISSATRDPRFTPVRLDEMRDIKDRVFLDNPRGEEAIPLFLIDESNVVGWTRLISIIKHDYT
jgi:uncharacterized protein (TIGR00296 family)